MKRFAFETASNGLARPNRNPGIAARKTDLFFHRNLISYNIKK